MVLGMREQLQLLPRVCHWPHCAECCSDRHAQERGAMLASELGQTVPPERRLRRACWLCSPGWRHLGCTQDQEHCVRPHAGAFQHGCAKASLTSKATCSNIMIFPPALCRFREPLLAAGHMLAH
jgi:hypothetical protein